MTETTQKLPTLKPKHKLFADYLIGEAQGVTKKAALLAGYSPKGAHSTGMRLARRPDVRAYCDAALESSPAAMGREERLGMISDIARDVLGAAVRDRLKALTLLSQIAGDLREAKTANNNVVEVHLFHPDPPRIEEPKSREGVIPVRPASPEFYDPEYEE